jgi:uncharacterized protein (TIGR01777 family)
MRALITGATGFIGRRLLERIDEPVVVTRDPKRVQGKLDGAEIHAWDPMSGPPPPEALRGVEAVFHLAGEPIAEGRWNEAKRRRLRESRVVGTANLVEGIRRAERRPRVLVSASAIGYYGSRGDEVLTESSSAGNDFLAEICAAWEAASAPAAELGVRVVNPRIGIVLGETGGALQKMLTPFKLGLGGRLGDGRQWMSWVHVDDVVGIMLMAADRADLRGPVNATAPKPVTNRDFTRTLAAVLHRPAILPAPAFGLRLLLGEFAEVLLGSQRVLPKVAEAAGYRFQFSDLESVLRSILDGAAA